MPGLDPTQFKTWDDFAKAITSSPKFQSVEDPAMRTNILNIGRKKYFEAHGVHQDVGPTDITPPIPDKATPKAEPSVSAMTTPGDEGIPVTVGGKDISTTPSPAPTPTTAPNTLPATQPKGDQLDEFGRFRQYAMGEGGGEAARKKYEENPLGATESDILATGARFLPGDRIQAGIDTAIALSMMTGAGEVEQVGGLGYKLLRQLPPIVRGVGRLGMRMLWPTAGGAIAGATQGRGMEGAERGAGEQLIGEGASFVLRGTTGLSARAIEKTDIKRLSSWLDGHMPDLGDFKSMRDFDRLFAKGELEDAAMEHLRDTEEQIGKQLKPKTSKAAQASGKANVFTPKAQDAEQDAALASVRSPGPTQAPPEPPKNVFTLGKKEEAAIPPYKEFKRVVTNYQKEISDAEKRGAGSRVIDEIKANLQRYQDDYFNKIDEMKSAKRVKTQPGPARQEPTTPRDTPEQIRAKEAAFQASRPKPTHLEIPLPGPMADRMGVPRRQPMIAEWDQIIAHLDEVQNAGWRLIGHPDPEKEETGKALRAAVVQAEHDVRDILDKRLGGHIADEWLARRQQARGARTITQMFRTSGATEAGATGKVHLNWGMLQDLATDAGRAGFYDDLKLAFGKEGADDFVNMLVRGESGGATYRDVPGRGPFSTHSRVYASPSGVSSHMRFGLQIPSPTIRTGDVPYNLGRNRALTALLILGPDQFLQFMGDMLSINNQMQEQASKQQAVAQ